MSTYEYYKEIFAKIPRPFALVDLDMLDDNARAIAHAAGGKKVRLASKSIRSVGVLNRILRSNPIFQGIMCYTARKPYFWQNRASMICRWLSAVATGRNSVRRESG